VPASLHRWDAFDDDWVQRLERRGAWEEPVSLEVRRRDGIAEREAAEARKVNQVAVGR
jgi:hypothetical protein